MFFENIILRDLKYLEKKTYLNSLNLFKLLIYYLNNAMINFSATYAFSHFL